MTAARNMGAGAFADWLARFAKIRRSQVGRFYDIISASFMEGKDICE